MNSTQQYQKEQIKEKEKEIRKELEEKLKMIGIIGIMSKNGIAITGVQYELQYPYIIIWSRDKTAQATIHVNEIEFII